MTREEAEEYAKKMSYRNAVYNALQGKCIPYRKATLIKLHELLNMVDMVEPKTGHWKEINYEDIDLKAICSNCGIWSPIMGNYCPYCGCRMIELQERKESD